MPCAVKSSFKIGAAATLFIYFVFYNHIHSYLHSYNTLIHLHSLRPLSVFFIAFAQREKPPRGAESGFELGPAVQQASSLSNELCCTLSVKITHIDSQISFDKNWFSRFKIGDHFFLNLNLGLERQGLAFGII
jgi:hypothetical protein